MSINSGFIASLLGVPQPGGGGPPPDINLALEAKKALYKGMMDGGPPPKEVRVKKEEDINFISYEA